MTLRTYSQTFYLLNVSVYFAQHALTGILFYFQNTGWAKSTSDHTSSPFESIFFILN